MGNDDGHGYNAGPKHKCSNVHTPILKPPSLRGQLSLFHPKNLRLATDDMGGFAFLSIRRLCPSLLQTDVHRRVDDCATFDLGAGQEHELAFVKDALGRDFGHVGHVA